MHFRGSGYKSITSALMIFTLAMAVGACTRSRPAKPTGGAVVSPPSPPAAPSNNSAADAQQNQNQAPAPSGESGGNGENTNVTSNSTPTPAPVAPGPVVVPSQPQPGPNQGGVVQQEPTPEPAAPATPTQPEPGPVVVTPDQPIAPQPVVRSEPEYGDEVLKAPLCKKIAIEAERVGLSLGEAMGNSAALVIPAEKVNSLQSGLSAQGVQFNPEQLRRNYFACAILPLAHQQNRKISQDRKRLIEYDKRQQRDANALSPAESIWLGLTKLKYGLEKTASNSEALKRVDVIPLPLLLAHAGMESDWGQGRAARELNNLFGLAGSSEDSECVPAEGGCLRTYDSLAAGMAEYILFMNSASGGESKFLEKFRDERARQRAAEAGKLNSFALAKELAEIAPIGDNVIDDVIALLAP